MKKNKSAPFMHLTTAGEAPHRRMELAREVFGRQILRIDVEPVSDAMPEVDLRLRALPGLKIMVGTTNAIVLSRSKSLLSDGNDDIFVSMVASGSLIAEQRRKRVVLAAGAVHLVSNSEPNVLSPHHFHGSGLLVPYKTISALVSNLDDRISSQIPQNPEGLTLLQNYTRIVLASEALENPAISQVVVSHIHDLVAHILGPNNDAVRLVQSRGLRSARLGLIKSYVVRHLSESDLSVQTVAAAHKITERYLQRLFETQESSFSAYVLNLRLQTAHRILSDPQHSGEPISAVAYGCGFRDVSHFNHMFKRHYGATPSDIRKQALRMPN